MQPRSATTPTDKVAGLAYFLCSFDEGNRQIPAYRGGTTADNAWNKLTLTYMSDRWAADLFFLYPFPSVGPVKWLPTWDQLMQFLPDVAGTIIDAKFTGTGRFRTYEGPTFAQCSIAGFTLKAEGTESVRSRPSFRRGTAVVGQDHLEFEVEAYHWHLTIIPDGEYTLLGTNDCRYWVVGTLDKSLRFTKVSILQMCKADSELIVSIKLASQKCYTIS